MEELDWVCDSVPSIDNDLANAKDELLRVQAQIVILITTWEAKIVEGTTLKLRIVAASSTVDHLRDEFIM